MTPLAETALGFCRNVLGWEHPVSEDDLLVFKTVPGQQAWGESFPYTDLNAVIPAVKEWCDRTGNAVELSYHGFIPGEWEA